MRHSVVPLILNLVFFSSKSLLTWSTIYSGLSYQLFREASLTLLFFLHWASQFPNVPTAHWADPYCGRYPLAHNLSVYITVPVHPGRSSGKRTHLCTWHTYSWCSMFAESMNGKLDCFHVQRQPRPHPSPSERQSSASVFVSVDSCPPSPPVWPAPTPVQLSLQSDYSKLQVSSFSSAFTYRMKDKACKVTFQVLPP